MSVEIHEEPGAAAAQPPVAPAIAATKPASPNECTVGGRTFRWRKMRTLERMDLNSIAGPEHSTNLMWMADASLAFAVTHIDGQPVPRPGTMAELRARILEIGDDGMDEISRTSMAAAGEAIEAERKAASAARSEAEK